MPTENVSSGNELTGDACGSAVLMLRVFHGREMR
jgi:hypothetical protein